MVTYRTAAHAAITNAFHGKLWGYIPDADHHRRQKDAGLLVGAGLTGNFNPVSLQQWQCSFLNQGQTGHCIGAGTAQILSIAFGAAGKALSWVPSPWSIYTLARILARDSASRGLADIGASPADLIAVLALYGIEPMRVLHTPDGRFDDVWGPLDLVGLPAVKPNVNEEPDLLDLEKSGLRVVTGQYRINETATVAIPQMVQALTSEIPAGIGIFVDTAFQRWDPTTGPIKSINLADPKGGGHWLPVSYAYPSPITGETIIGGPNSWGEEWPMTVPGDSVPGSPFWKPGHYEITASGLTTALADCLLFPVGAS